MSQYARLLVAMDEAIEIWGNRAKGIEDDKDCPLCEFDRVFGNDDCGCCPIGDGCHHTPFDRWNWTFNQQEEIEAAIHELAFLKWIRWLLIQGYIEVPRAEKP